VSLLEVSQEEGGGEQSEEAQTAHEKRFYEVTQELEANGIVYESVDLTDDQEAEKLPLPSLDNFPPPTGVELSSCGFICREYPNNNHISQIAKSRARDSITRQREFILDAVQSIQNDGSVQSKASDRAAKSLRVLASHVIQDDSLNSSGDEPVRNIFRLLLPLF